MSVKSNFGLNKLGFNSIRENQRIEAYLCERDVLMITPTGSGKSLTFQISPYVIDYVEHGDQHDDIKNSLSCHCTTDISNERPGVDFA